MKERDPDRQPWTAREAAKDLIRPYVHRGESLASLRSSALGAITERYRAGIGPVVEQRTRPDLIGVVVVWGDGEEELVSLVEAYDEVSSEIEDRPRQVTLFEF